MQASWESFAPEPREFTTCPVCGKSVEAEERDAITRDALAAGIAILSDVPILFTTSESARR